MGPLITNVFATVLVILGAASASAYSTSVTSSHAAQTVGVGDTVTVDVVFDTEGAANITLLSVAVHFDNGIFSHSGSSAPTSALEAPPGQGGAHMVPASTNGSLRIGTSDQVNFDWISNDLPNGQQHSGSFTMGTLTFTVHSLGDGVGEFVLSNNSAGNVLQLANGSQPGNSVSGHFVVITPEPSTAALLGLGLLGLALAGRP